MWRVGDRDWSWGSRVLAMRSDVIRLSFRGTSFAGNENNNMKLEPFSLSLQRFFFFFFELLLGRRGSRPRHAWSWHGVAAVNMLFARGGPFRDNAPGFFFPP
jgi:hypothetical protein